jgi:hypothetical protein
MHGVCTPKGVCTALAHTNVFDLSGLLQLDHGFYRLLDRRYFVQAMDVIQVDIWQAKPLERLLNCNFAVLRG